MNIDLIDYLHIESRSTYNHNYYQNKINGEIILVICDEFMNELNVYKVSETRDFLFSCVDNLDGILND